MEVWLGKTSSISPARKHRRSNRGDSEPRHVGVYMACLIRVLGPHGGPKRHTKTSLSFSKIPAPAPASASHPSIPLPPYLPQSKALPSKPCPSRRIESSSSSRCASSISSSRPP
ncbi:hypothetical protein EJ03DRAFT_215360 [Teratosphaeria nubilosa]|uniref:Uncharacterized protein n=1 Tax=Teratosphaeria nubilosa TaxID=161662 RepID=A0A6G1LH57_9PEZI|nr:hypothetical protein EJ03DRAFT_215360 [Teratosphaeria nubilosa]